MTNQVIHGDCMDVMREMEANSIDTIITDPPYALTNRTPDVKRCLNCSRVLGGRDGNPESCPKCGGKLSRQRSAQNRGFMGKDWDSSIPGIPFWAEMLRVAKPGATLLAFGGTRTHHRLMVAIEDAGWEIRDCLMWLYGSGFPKSHNISKGIDRAIITDCANCDGKGFVMPELPSYEELAAEDPDNHITYEDWLYFQTPEGIIARQYKCADCNGTGKVKGKEREVVGKSNRHNGRAFGSGAGDPDYGTYKGGVPNITAPATEAAATWEGFGTGLKPAYEPIIYAQKPIESTYANNAQVWNVAGLNIDGARIGASDDDPNFRSRQAINNLPFTKVESGLKSIKDPHDLSARHNKNGRWPANVLLSHAEGCVRRGEKRIKGITGGKEPKRSNESNTLVKGIGNNGRQSTYVDYADSNGLETVADWECVEGCPIRILDEQAGVRKSGAKKVIEKKGEQTGAINNGEGFNANEYRIHSKNAVLESSTGSASRFFYIAKAPNREKWFFCQLCAQAYPNKERDDHGHGIDQGQRKHIVAHPTVKPLSILKYLCTLTKTPTGGIVLDPFAGSGTTGLACLETGRDFILIEKESDYYEIAKARVEAAMSEPRQAELW